MRQYHVDNPAEGFAAAVFALAGCDALVQHGANARPTGRCNTQALALQCSRLAKFLPAGEDDA